MQDRPPGGGGRGYPSAADAHRAMRRREFKDEISRLVHLGRDFHTARFIAAELMGERYTDFSFLDEVMGW